MARDTGCTADTSRCEFWNWGEDYLRPECCTSHLLAVARFVRGALEQHGVHYWLDYGPLLGAVRDGHLIPWDTDVDFGYLAEDHDRVVAALRAELPGTGHHLELDDGVVRVNFSPRNDQHADLFAWRDDGGMLTVSFEDDLVWPGARERDPFPVRFVERLESVLLEGTEFPAPSPVHEFLAEHRYGPDYLVPMRGVITSRFSVAIGVEEFTPAVRALWDELGHEERRLLALSYGRSKEDSFRARWRRAGLPRAPRPADTARQLERVPVEERAEVARELAEHLALAKQSISELEHPWRSSIRRNTRRVRRVARKARQVLRGRRRPGAA